jgi:hypothetical protein
MDHVVRLDCVFMADPGKGEREHGLVVRAIVLALIAMRDEQEYEVIVVLDELEQRP